MDIYSYCRFKQYDDVLEEASDDACAYFAREFLNRSAFDLDEGELEEAKNYVSKMMNLGAADAESSKFVNDDMIEQMSRHMLMSAVSVQKLKPLTKQDYEEYLNRRAVARQCMVDEVRRSYPVIDYLLDTYNELFTDSIEAYVLWKLKETGESLH